MKKETMEVHSPVPLDVWQEAVAQDPNAMISHTPQWIESICQGDFYTNASLLFELSAGRQIVLPAVRYKYLPAIVNSEKSLPHGWGIGGPIASGGVSRDEISRILSWLSTRPGKRVSLRPNPLQAAEWKSSAPPSTRSERHSTHILSLEGGFDQVWSHQFSSATRNKIHKAEKSGLTIEKDTSGALLPEFYRLYLAWSERRARERHIPALFSRGLAQVREPYRKFVSVFNHCAGACQLWVARSGNQVAAAAFLLIWGEHAQYWRSASDKELTLQTRANDLLQKVMIEEACLSGCRYYHMGESGGVASLKHFKTRFGASEVPYEEYYLGSQPLGGVFEKANSFVQHLGSLLIPQRREGFHETHPDD